MSPSSPQHPDRPQSNHVENLLDSWKEIASYLQRTVSTVKRWEKKEGLPVHRHLHNKQGTVYAYQSELDTWLEARRQLGSKDEKQGYGFSLLSGNRRMLGMTVAGGLALVAGLLWWLSTGQAEPKVTTLDFQQRDWVLITDFENRTGESVFDGVLEYALEREIANSQFVNVVPRERIEDTLRLMRRPLDTRIDPEVAREISLRDGGIKAFLKGRVDKLDSTYLLSIELIDTTTGQGIAATSEEAAGQSEVFSAITSLSNWARKNLGEKLALIQESERKLEKVATPSLRAVQLFTDARTLLDRRPEGQGPAEGLLKQAVDIDPEFASAHIYLALAIRNQGKSAEEYLPYAETAFQLADTASQRERYFIHGSYYDMKSEKEKALQAYGNLLALYPDHFGAIDNLALQFRGVGDEQRALTYWLRRADLRPNNFDYTHRAALQLLLNGDLARAKTYWSRALDLMTPEDIERNTNTAIQLMWFPAFEALLHTDPETGLREANRLSGTLRSFEERGFFNYEPTGAFYLTLGKIGLAKEWFEETDNVDSRRHYFLAAVAYVEEDHKAMTEHLRQWLEARESLRRTRGRRGPEPSETRRMRDPVPVRNVLLLLARGGLLSEAEELFARRGLRLPDWPDARREQVERRLDIQRGVLALSRGNRNEGIRLLENALAAFGPWDNSASLYFMGSEILAQAWTEQGKSDEAIQVLREALEKKSRLLVEQSLLTGPIWLRLQAQLAQLYSEVGRDEDARKIEEELRRRLALADPDHPIILQLEQTRQLAVQQAVN